MASVFLFTLLTSLSVLCIFDCLNSLGTGVYYNEEYQNEGLDTNYYKASKKPYFNPFGYKTCRSGKFRFDWMREKSSFSCPASGGGRRSEFEQLGDPNEYKAMGKSRIIKGFFADVGEFPSFVQVKIGDPFLLRGKLCGGFLLNEYLVLTAGHCLQNHTAGFVYAGSIDHLKGQRRTIKRACIPEEYREKETDTHDWALLELDDEFRLSRNVQPACVNFDYKLAKDIKCVAVGFGITDQANKTSPLLKAAVVKQYEPYVDQPGLIWTSKVMGESTSGELCTGDSGGPLYCFENCSGPPKMYVVGLASFANGTGCFDSDSGVFVNTVSFRKVMPILIKKLMDMREKRLVRRLTPSGEMNTRPLSTKGIHCVNFQKPIE